MFSIPFFAHQAMYNIVWYPSIVCCLLRHRIELNKPRLMPCSLTMTLLFILDSKLSMKKHVIKICQTAYFELKRISSSRRFLTDDATKILVTSYIVSRLDYCSCLLMGTPNSVIQPLQKNSELCCKTCSLGHATTTQHLSWKNCTGFPFQKVLSIKSLVCVSVL